MHSYRISYLQSELFCATVGTVEECDVVELGTYFPIGNVSYSEDNNIHSYPVQECNSNKKIKMFVFYSSGLVHYSLADIEESMHPCSG